MSESTGGQGSSEAPVVRPASLTHGFLFADLRGYTSYLDRRGAVAAAALLDRFRDLVRGAVATHDGAEIRTEGDSFYIVFPSASMAVDCALDIVRGAADEVLHRDDPIQVGVGVHAGEAVETPDGPVGTAVNVAARLCAMAAPGEVVVSDTVRALTRSVGTAGYVPLGRRPIKGLDESLSVYRAVPAGTAVKRRRVVGRSRAITALAGTAGLAAIIVAVLAFRPQSPSEALPSGSLAARPTGSIAAGPSGAAPTMSSPSATANPIGYFQTIRFAVPFNITLGRGWDVVGYRPDLAAFGHDSASPTGWIDVILVAATLDPPCADTAPQFLGARPQDIIDWLSTRTWLDHGVPRPYNIGTYLGRSVDVTVPPASRWSCPTSLRNEIAQFFRLGSPTLTTEFGSLWGADVGERKRFIAIDVGGRTVTLAVGSPYPDVEKLWALAEPLLQTIEFTQPAS